jgi:hypothetical protein
MLQIADLDPSLRHRLRRFQASYIIRKPRSINKGGAQLGEIVA